MPETPYSGQNRWFSVSIRPWNLMDDLEKQYGISFMLLQALCQITQPSVKSNSSHRPESPNSDQNWQFLVPCNIEILWMTLKNNRASLLCYFKHCASFHNHRWIQARVTVQKHPIWVKICDFFVRPDLQIWWMISKTIGHLFYATSSFVHHFVVIYKFQLEFRSGNDQIGAKFVLISVTLTFDLWPCPSAWTSHVSLVITPRSFMMIRSEEHSEKGVTDTQPHRQTHRQADRQADGRTKVFLELLGRS